MSFQISKNVQSAKRGDVRKTSDVHLNHPIRYLYLVGYKYFYPDPTHFIIAGNLMFGIGAPEMGILLWFIIPGIIGGIVASRKGRSGLIWFLLCAILPVLVLIPPFLSQVPRKGKFAVCPACNEIINWHATICKHCHTELADEFED